MKYTKEMLLESPSGFMMPFSSTKEDTIQVSLGYGEQNHPQTGEKFYHSGLDFAVSQKPLYALATGIVVGVGNNAVHDNFLVCRYGKYDVKYGHLSECFVNYGQSVQAGQQIATSGDFLHFEVSFNGEVLDPDVFIDMLYGNIVQLSTMGIAVSPQFYGEQFNTHSSYEADMPEIEQLLLRWLPSYMSSISSKSYIPSGRMEQSLRNIFTRSAEKNYFFETVPTIGNPLGMSERGLPLINKIQDLLISDFLSFLALKHNIYPSRWDDAQKKNFLFNWHPKVKS